MSLDFPKIQSPFVRCEMNGRYLVTPTVAEGYEWVFTDDSVMAIEKLDGTNVSIVVRDVRVQSVWNRTTEIPIFGKGKSHIIMGLLASCERGYLSLPDGQHFGELIGPKLQGNPYQLDEHLWIPFNTYGREHLRYKSWGRYPKTFETISAWFRDDLFSLFTARRTSVKAYPEGIVFHHPDGRMAKLRRDMFDWYAGKGHKPNETQAN